MMMFTVEQATPDVSAAFVPYYATLMADVLVASQTDLDHPDQPVLTLVGRGFTARVVAPCLDHAIRLAKENRHAPRQQQQQLVP